MMKAIVRALCLVLSLAAVLCGCSSENKASAEAVAELDSAIKATNGSDSAKGSYVLEITFGESSVLYYAKGDIEFDRAQKKAYADFDQTWLGSAVSVQNYYSNGRMTSVTNGEPLELERDENELFSKFPYSMLLPLEEDASIVLGNNSFGKTFSLARTDTSQICETVVGDIYSLVSVIKKPQRDKTKYSDASVIYTVSEGKVVSCRYEFTAVLFDTPAYVPGYQPPESEYTVEVKVSAKVSYSEFGESVSVPDYSAPEESK
ncbi:MAG: hypothetical protein IJO64_00315 [Clostridia bacterium]|nr:hypothetical protein [Clostridia bacterium]MBQ9847488.1 hypothetical protein [Clostridia bacterium]